MSFLRATTSNYYRKARKFYNTHLQHTPVHFISHPKTGRTWLRVMLGKVICQQYGMPENDLLDSASWNRYIPQAVKFHHDDSMRPWGNLRYDQLAEDKHKYQDAGVVFIVRDPRDVLVSFYFEITKRKKFYQLADLFEGDMHAFLRSEVFGIRKCLRFYNIWHANRALPRDFLLVRYEDMHANPGGVLGQVLDFMDIEDVSTETLASAVAFAGFDNMRQLEASDALGTDELRPSDQSDAESYKTRKGKIGGYRQYLDQDDLDYIRAVAQEMGSPFYPQLAESPADLG